MFQANRIYAPGLETDLDEILLEQLGTSANDLDRGKAVETFDAIAWRFMQ
jgi:hypothetical protein